MHVLAFKFFARNQPATVNGVQSIHVLALSHCPLMVHVVVRLWVPTPAMENTVSSSCELLALVPRALVDSSWGYCPALTSHLEKAGRAFAIHAH